MDGRAAATPRMPRRAVVLLTLLKIVASLDLDGPAETTVTIDYEDCCTKARTRKIGARLLDSLHDIDAAVTMVVTRDDEMRYSAPSGRHSEKMRDFLVTQKEVVVVEEKLAEQAARRMNGPGMTMAWRKRQAAARFQKSQDAAHAAAGSSKNSAQARTRKSVKDEVR